MKLLVGFLTLLLALCISGVAAYFSVVGLAAIFAATPIAVVIMGVSLEAGKLLAAGWLHGNWKNPKVNALHKGYMVAAVVALMLITALGIYGFLAKGHLEQQTPLAPIELQIASTQADIDAVNTDLVGKKAQLGQLDAAINSMIGQDKASMGLRARGKQSAERKEIQIAIDTDTKKVQDLNKSLIPLKLQINEVETKLGPIKYIAALFGFKDTESAVRVVILILMFAFDPLAVVLVLSASISIADGLELRRRIHIPGVVLPKSQPDVPMPPVKERQSIFPDFGLDIPMPEGVAVPLKVMPRVLTDRESYELPPEEETPSNILVELEEHKREMSDKERLLDILERKPELLQTIVDAIKDEDIHKEAPQKTDSWLGTDLNK